MSTTRGDYAPRAITDLHEATGDANNILLLTDTETRTVQTWPPDAADLILVSLGAASNQDQSIWESTSIDNFERVRLLGAEPLPTNTPDNTAPEDFSVQTIEHPTNLTALGRHIADYLTADSTTEQQTVVSFHSLTTLLAHLDIHRVFYFIHLMTGRINATNATAYFYLYPAAQHPTSIKTLSPLFDRHLRALPDNRWATTSPRANETEYL